MVTWYHRKCTFINLLFSSLKVVGDACWALSYITDGTTERIQAVIDSQVTPRLVQLLNSDDMNWVVSKLTLSLLPLYYCE